MIGVVHCTDHELSANNKKDVPIEEPIANNVVAAAREEQPPADDGDDHNGQGGAHAMLPMLFQPHLYRPATILVMGDSFVRRLKEFARRKFGENDNLGFQFHMANVSWYGVGGLTIDRFRHHHMQNVFNVRPDILFIQLGSNDLADAHKSPEEVANAMELLVEDFLDAGVHQVIVSQVLFREGRGLPARVHNYNGKVTIFNFMNKLTFNPNYTDVARFWYHKGLWHKRQTTLCHDGVHFNSRGSRNYYRSVRGALMQALTRVRANLARPVQAPANRPAILEF